MTLGEQEWMPIEKEKFFMAFWTSEKSKIFRPGQKSGDITLSSWKRLRAPLTSRIPADTVWHEVKFLTHDHLGEIHVIGRSGWDAKGADKDQNELRKVAARKPVALTHKPEQWPHVVLWAHSKKGPFTILEGNHRLVAYAGAPSVPPFSITAIVGISPSPCCWHIQDPVGLFL